MTNSEQIEVGNKGVFPVVDLLLITGSITLQRVIGKMDCSQLQNGITIGLKSLIAALSGMDAAC